MYRSYVPSTGPPSLVLCTMSINEGLGANSVLVKVYVPQRFTFHSRSPYHSGQGGIYATCFISFPESFPLRAHAASMKYRNREDTGASAASAPSPPNSQEKATKTSATGESCVQPNNGEISRRVCADGFHATVGPRVKLFTASPRVSLVVTFLYSISRPIFRRSLGRRMGVIIACEKPHSRPRSPVFSFSKNQFMAHSTCSPKS